MAKARAPSSGKRSDHTTRRRQIAGRARINGRVGKRFTGYTDQDFEDIATAAGVQTALVKQQDGYLEAAARWYFSDARSPSRARPTELSKLLEQIRDTADRLLAHLGIRNVEDACEGPPNEAVFDALMLATEGGGTEEDVKKVSEKIWRLFDVFDAICATLDLRNRAHEAARDVKSIGKLTIPKGRHGDGPLNGWTLQMLSMYRHLTRVDARLPLDHGQAKRLYRFLSAAGRPLDVVLSLGEWRERVRTVLNQPTA
jgi:hypothetical protein